MTERVVLAYSGGLDTSVAVRWLIENEGVEVIAVAVNVGQSADKGGEDWDAIRARAKAAGAVEAVVIDARAEMAEQFCLPALAANARYEGKYPLVSALSRPVIVRHLVAEARRHGATAVAHGCTGKGNDQVRFEVGTRALAPDLRIYAPARVWGLTREDCVELAAKWEIPITVTKDKLYSIDDNLWGKAIECGAIEDPWAPAPDDVYTLTRVTETDPVEVIVGFEAGVPVSLDGTALSPLDLISQIGALAGSRGFGRLDMVENRRKSASRAARSTNARPRSRSSSRTVIWRTSPSSATCITKRRVSSRAGPSWSTTVCGSRRSSRPSTPSWPNPSVTSRARSASASLRPAPAPWWAVVARSLSMTTTSPPTTRPTRSATPMPKVLCVCGDPRRRHLVGPSGTGRSRPRDRGSRGRIARRWGDDMTLWEGRISAGMAEAVADFTVSLPFDKELAFDDLAGSRAHVKGLGKAGILSAEEVTTLLETLGLVEAELASGAFVFAPGDEDVHTAVERRVTELAGDVGAKLHTGRSRNDQIATDLRLWCRRTLVSVAGEVMALQDVLAQRARDAGDTYLPGYTHLQRAQPVLLSHHLLAHGWALARDVDRLLATVDRLNVSPLGAGALAGSSLPLDPDYVAAELGFAARFENSLDAVSDRDFVAEALFDIALLGVHLSRMGEELVLWSTEEFGFCTLDDAYATGSSMLPQKKNPDVAELARGKTGRLIGHLSAVLITLKGLPLAYNRDLQEDKEPLFDAVIQVTRALIALRGVYDTVTWNEGRMQSAADGPAAAAIDLAEQLVTQGMPFRQAHALVGAVVRDSLERHVPLVELVAAHPALGEAAVELLEPGVAVTRRRTPGGAGPGPVAEQTERFARRREVDRTRLGHWLPSSS